MNPERLAARTTNTQLEPIARAIESAVPTTRSGFLPDDPSNQIPKTGNMITADRTHWFNTLFDIDTNCTLSLSVNSTLLRLRPHTTAHSLAQGATDPTTSLENPLLRLTADEYRTLRCNHVSIAT